MLHQARTSYLIVLLLTLRLEGNLGENLQASRRALVYVPSVATLFAECQPLGQGSPHIHHPGFDPRQLFFTLGLSAGERSSISRRPDNIL